MKRATYDDILGLPDHVVGEILDGELVVSPRPASPHALAAGGLLHFSASFSGAPGDGQMGGPGGWAILREPEIHFGEDVIVPDLVGWRRERMPKVPNTAYFTLAPDWVCEVASPSTERIVHVKPFEIRPLDIKRLWPES